MLANQPSDPMILATDLAGAREFYGELRSLGPLQFEGAGAN
jgi:hypothetical protein